MFSDKLRVPERGGVGEGAECLFKIAMKQYLGLLIIIEGGAERFI